LCRFYRGIELEIAVESVLILDRTHRFWIIREYDMTGNDISAVKQEERRHGCPERP
jgi:hypothetical protein